MPTRRKHLVGAMVVLLGAASGRSWADGVAQVLTAKTIPAATVALIDPESGTSVGGGSTDVKVATGDVILFRLKYFPVPDKIVRGLQGYVTDYIPANTEVVGVRLTDEAGLTVVPRFPGIAPDGCARTCNGFGSVPSSTGPRSLQNGSISQVYADTGVFFATASELARAPSDVFITFQNGIVMNPQPRNVSAITGLLGASSPIHSHNPWDWAQVRAFGIQQATSGNSGTGNTPHGYGSPVAGPQTHYRFEATEVMPGVIQFNDREGPWQRIRYPGSQVGSGAAVNSGGTLRRTNVATALGHDLSPANPLPTTTRAVRLALGEVRVGEPGFAEIALRVRGTPLDPAQMRDVNCAEVFGGDTSAASDSVRARDNPWSTYLASPGCVYLNLLFDLDVDKPLARTGDVLTYTLHGKNLSLNAQSNASVRLKYDSNALSYVAGSGTGTPSVVPNCDGDGKSCLVWPTRDLARSAEYTHTARFTVGGGGHVTNVMFANYRSDQLPAPGHTTQALTIVREVAVVKTTLQPANSPMVGGMATFSGTLENRGSGAASYETLTVVLPPGWVVNGGIMVGNVPRACASGCASNQPTFTLGATLAAGEVRPLTFSATVPASAASGLYPVDLQVWASQSMFGGRYETYFPQVATVSVGASRSTPPDIKCSIPSSAQSISGTSSAANGATVRLYFAGIERGTGTVTNGTWTVSNYGAFGSLYAGLEVRATVQAPGQLESELSPACFVSFTPACSDGVDNDGDGRVDFPADPGCESPLDHDERDSVTQCSDGLDNDGDGLIDMQDPSCSAPWDDDESGAPACADGIDNDDDGKIDFPADPGCATAQGRTEVDLAACQDGLDNDGDGKVDFPADPGCHSAFDDSEADPAALQATVRPRLLIAFDTSGSMNWHTCKDEYTGGDGSLECAGGDVACSVCNASGCGDGVANDSRLFKVKAGVSDVLRAFGEIEFGLMRFHQRAEPFVCPTSNASLRSGGWQGAGAAPCGGGFDAGDLLVAFGHENRYDLMTWMDGRSNYEGTPPRQMDWELRGSGTTPLGGILKSALTHLQTVRTGDARAACRPYRVVLVTDGAETCAGNPAAAAAQLLAAGIKVHVIGFATPDPTMVASLDAIAAAGGTGKAVTVEDAAALSAAIATIVGESVLVERCNDVDDDCDGMVDEDFPDKDALCDNGKLGICRRTGVRVCGADQISTTCNAPDVSPGVEACPPNGLDDDCNGIIDDIAGGCPTCTTEVCNGRDDDCDGKIDEPEDLFPCPNGQGVCPPPCGSTIGTCAPGTLACVMGKLTCQGGVDPTLEVCDGLDNDCNTVIDGFTRRCYPAATPGCDLPSGQCAGICRFGAEICPRLSQPATGNEFGPCMGAVTPQREVCNGLDDDCNGTVDDVPGGCDRTCIPGPEKCDGIDNNCNGIVDEDVPGTGDACVEGFDASRVGVGMCRAGRKACIGGMWRCQGSTGPLPAEICDGVDNDCNGTIDDEAPCPSGFSCVAGACQPVCRSGEFPCPADRTCIEASTRSRCDRPGQPGCVCLANPCLKAGCDAETELCVINDGVASCVDRCRMVNCPTGTTCVPRSGACLDCHRLGCPTGEICLGSPGRCQRDLCHGVACGPGTFCQAGECRTSCQNVRCPAGQACVTGQCRASRCAGVTCEAETLCNPDTGRCERDMCIGGALCRLGEACVPSSGQCVPDPCATLRCGDCSRCQIGFDGQPACGPDPTCVSRGSVSVGGSGCACATGPGGTKDPIPLPLVIALGSMVLVARGRRNRR